MLTPVRKKNKGETWWLRKKVPFKLRAIVGRSEVWRSLQTTDRRVANTRCAVTSASLEADWARMAGEEEGSRSLFQRSPLSHQDLHALKGIAHLKTRDNHLPSAGGGLAAMRWVALRDRLSEPSSDDDEALDRAVRDFLAGENVAPTEADLQRLKPLYAEGRRNGYDDVLRASRGDFSESPLIKTYPNRTTPRLDFVVAFEEYAEKGELKGGAYGPTAKRWRPKVRNFCDWLGHRDLAGVTGEDGIDYMDHLKAEGIAAKSIRDVWLASLKATAGFMIERKKLRVNPFIGIRVRGVKESKSDDEKGFSDKQAKQILTATLGTPSRLISVEMRAARRWVPWLCAYSGARVNEITSLSPEQIRKIDGFWCIVLRADLTKSETERRVPIHKHAIEQGFLEYVDQRRKRGMPLFYDPARSRGGKTGNPHWHKVAERLAEWIRDGLGIVGVAPNHGWRHRFKSVARDVGMHAEVANFIIGHGGGTVSERYGSRWVKTAAKAIAMYPRYRIEALKQPPAPHKRIRRTSAQIAADREAQKRISVGLRAS
jgi:site-specific recombinase XerD